MFEQICFFKKLYIMRKYCLTLCLLYGLENIGFVYPSMSMIVMATRSYTKTKTVQSDV
jgi:hypothetical protein